MLMSGKNHNVPLRVRDCSFRQPAASSIFVIISTPSSGNRSSTLIQLLTSPPEENPHRPHNGVRRRGRVPVGSDLNPPPVATIRPSLPLKRNGWVYVGQDSNLQATIDGVFPILGYPTCPPHSPHHAPESFLGVATKFFGRSGSYLRPLSLLLP